MSDVSIRTAVQDDLVDLTDIYNYYVVHTAATFDVEPFLPAQRTLWFADHSDGRKLRLLVATDTGGRVIGYAGSGRHRPKPAYDSTVELTVYVDRNWVGRRVGSRLCRALLNELAGQDVRRVVSGVAQPNEASNALHQKLGFEVVGTYHEVGLKFGKYWDVTWFERDMKNLASDDI